MTNKTLQVDNISLTLNKNIVLRDINFSLEKGEIACLLGPSGCGKTSLLRVIAGLESRSLGMISLDGNQIQNQAHFTPPEKRNIGMVFQDYALFPHFNVEENILFSIEHFKNEKKHQKLNELLALVQLEKFRKSYPHQLSGGQQQRVALARALAQEPAILLLDEPFSNLDTELRYQLSEDVRAILKSLNMTAILVTHDQNEAFSFADKIGVINNGVIEQFASSYDLYHSPQTLFIAQFIGEGVIVKGELLRPYLLDHNENLLGLVLIRPDDITHNDDSALKAKIIKKTFRGSHFLYLLEFENKMQVLSLVQSHHNHYIGDLIGVKIEIDHLIEFTL